MKASMMKSIDIFTYVLLLIGALNWGMVGVFGFDMVAALFGQMSVFSRMVYAIVGLAALYDLMSLPSIFKRWDIHLQHHPIHA